jgi:ElaB/YqjD/DUF883 family membrane-anchored ribosome-binding protein
MEKVADKTDKKIIDEAVKRFKICEEAMREIRAEAEDDMKFKSGDQWPDGVMKDREADGRPTLVINKLPTYINQVVNDIKMNKPGIEVKGVDESNDPDTAEVIQGIIRHIQNNSKADIAFTTALEHAVSCGFGFIRMRNDYISEKSRDQEIIIDRIGNNFSVWAPIHVCNETDYSDMPYCFITEDVPREDFENQYPKAETVDFDFKGQDQGNWLTEKTIRVAEYYRIVKEKKTVVLLRDGSSMLKEEIPSNLPAEVETEKYIIKEWESEIKKVEWYKLTSQEILEKTPIPGKYIPVIPVLGAEINLNGKKKYISLIRWAKDAQRMLNYWKSCFTENVALAPKAPFMGAEGQFEGYENQYQLANRKNYAFLQYRPVSLNGQILPAPQRISPPQIPTAYIEAMREATQDIKETTGIYDASLGSKSNETSGRAILARQHEGDVSNYHFSDNLATAMRHCGRIMVDWIPEIYDTARTIRILGKENEEKIVKINQEYGDPKTGRMKLYDMRAGQYDVVIQSGPSFNTQRERASEIMVEMMRSNPAISQIAGDLVAKYADAPGEIVDRLQKALPPQLQPQTEKGQEQGHTPQEMQQVVADLQNVMQQLQVAEQEKQQMAMDVQKLMEALKDKSGDRNTKLTEAKIKAFADVQKEAIKARPDKIQQIEATLAYIIERLGIGNSMQNEPEPARPAGNNPMEVKP